MTAHVTASILIEKKKAEYNLTMTGKIGGYLCDEDDGYRVAFNGSLVVDYKSVDITILGAGAAFTYYCNAEPGQVRFTLEIFAEAVKVSNFLMEDFFLTLDFHLGEPVEEEMRQPPAELGSPEREYLGDRSVDGVTHDAEEEERGALGADAATTGTYVVGYFGARTEFGKDNPAVVVVEGMFIPKGAQKMFKIDVTLKPWKISTESGMDIELVGKGSVKVPGTQLGDIRLEASATFTDIPKFSSSIIARGVLLMSSYGEVDISLSAEFEKDARIELYEDWSLPLPDQISIGYRKVREDDDDDDDSISPFETAPLIRTGPY